MKTPWFKRKSYGWGWYPATWQGWLVLVGYIVLFISGEIIFIRRIMAEPNAVDITVYAIFVAVITGGLIWICYKTGESPRWQWGEKEKDK